MIYHKSLYYKNTNKNTNIRRKLYDKNQKFYKKRFCYNFTMTDPIIFQKPDPQLGESWFREE